jgi:hypothetical protein
MRSPYFISAEERASNLINSFDPPLDEWLRGELFEEIVALVKEAERAIRLEDITIAERWSSRNAAQAIRSRL